MYNVSASSPPFLIINSDDEIVPVEQAQALQEALSAAGRPSTLRIVPGQDHGLVLLDSVEDDVVTFLRA